jgi:hypothetical protein
MSSGTVAGNDRNNLALMIRNVPGKVLQDKLNASSINTTEESS